MAVPLHSLSTTLSETEVSNCLAPEPWLFLFTYQLQHSARHGSAIVSLQNRGCSCSLTLYNTQRDIALSKADVTNYIVPEPWLIVLNYQLQHSASPWSATPLSWNPGRNHPLTSYNTQRDTGQQLCRSITVDGPVLLLAVTLIDPFHLPPTSHNEPDVSYRSYPKFAEFNYAQAIAPHRPAISRRLCHPSFPGALLPVSPGKSGIFFRSSGIGNGSLHSDAICQSRLPVSATRQCGYNMIRDFYFL
ncbi:hypothetical protein C7212DRAFT_365301 [Tuber magnatum]|uniref:Uncharacterized protein n=1 Tax=Tuber magnatum TaxID=42249 RepID=A0A317SIK7_9PEZI|nr:hypothetical protein C7212DRAFT_365301 [Tuber magnatum]